LVFTLFRQFPAFFDFLKKSKFSKKQEMLEIFKEAHKIKKNWFLRFSDNFQHFFKKI
jgi:hypothetical protein